MFISKAHRFHQDDDGKYVAYDYFRLMKARITPEGKKRNDQVMALGPLEGLTRRERDELADMLTVMIEQGQSVMSFTPGSVGGSPAVHSDFNRRSDFLSTEVWREGVRQ